MADRTSIEWTDATWNPIRARRRDTGKVGWHCEAVSAGCKNCYAGPINEVRFGTGLPYKPGHRAEVEVFIDLDTLRQPMRWRKGRTIFVCSMTDLFGDFVPVELIDQVFAVMALASQHTFQVLTKRSARMRAYLTDEDLNDRLSATLGTMLDGEWIWHAGKRFRARIEHMIGAFLGESTDDDGDVTHHDNPMPLPNVWCGVSAEDQDSADQRVPDLLATPAAVRFVSAEPLIGAIDFLKIPVRGEAEGFRASALHGHEIPNSVGECLEWVPPLDWIIVGGESGPGARPMHPAWARSIRDQCRRARVPFMFKQWGAWTPAPAAAGLQAGGNVLWPDGTHGHGSADRNGGPGVTMIYAGKKAAGRTLDGCIHDELAIPF